MVYILHMHIESVTPLLTISLVAAQFTHIHGKQSEKKMDAVIQNVTSAKICAQLCVTKSDFVCNSFDICPTDQTCRMDRHHIGDDGQLSPSLCSHYSSKLWHHGIANVILMTAISLFAQYACMYHRILVVGHVPRDESIHESISRC